jgi:acyl-CoA thioesterase-1
MSTQDSFQNSVQKLLTLVLALVSLSGLSFAAQATANSKPWERQPTVLVLGDSISAGFGVPDQQGWVTLLQSSLEQQVPLVKVINASSSGETTAGGAARLGGLIQQHRPDLLVIELGGNDALRGTPLQEIRKNLVRMIETAENEGVMVMLLGMQIPPNYGPAYTQGFAQLYTDLADERGTLLLPFLLDGIATQAGMMQDDGIHPTAKAQPLMTRAVVDSMDIWIEFTNNQ